MRKPDLRRVRPAAPPRPSSSPGESLVGRRVREPVTSTRFREGTVAARDAETRLYTVRYDDAALPLRTGVTTAEVLAIALPKGERKASRIIVLPAHPIKRRDAQTPSPPKAKAKAESGGAKRCRSDVAEKAEKEDAKPAKVAKPSKSAKAAPPGSVEAFIRSIQPPLAQVRPSCAPQVTRSLRCADAARCARAQLSSILALVPSSGVTMAHLAQAAKPGNLQAVYLTELLKMLGVTAGLDRLAFISALEQLAPQA